MPWLGRCAQPRATDGPRTLRSAGEFTRADNLPLNVRLQIAGVVGVVEDVGVRELKVGVVSPPAGPLRDHPVDLQHACGLIQLAAVAPQPRPTSGGYPLPIKIQVSGASDPLDTLWR